MTLVYPSGHVECLWCACGIPSVPKSSAPSHWEASLLAMTATIDAAGGGGATAGGDDIDAADDDDDDDR